MSYPCDCSDGMRQTPIGWTACERCHPEDAQLVTLAKASEQRRRPRRQTTSYVFEGEELEQLRAVGKARNAAKKPSWTRRRSDAFTDAEVDGLGVIGEAAWARYLDVEMDFSIHAHGDGGVDLIYEGQSIAVKFNHRWRGFLIVERRPADKPPVHLEDLQADIIALAHGTCKPPAHCYCRQTHFEVHVAGWLPEAHFRANMLRRDWGLGGRYVMRPAELNSPHTLRG